MTPVDFETEFFVRLHENERRYVLGYGDVTGSTSWHAVPGRPLDRLRLLLGNLLHVTLGQMDARWSAALDYDQRGQPSALILSDTHRPALVIDLKLSTELLRLKVHDGRHSTLVLREGGGPIIAALAEICAEHFVPLSAGAGAIDIT